MFNQGFSGMSALRRVLGSTSLVAVLVLGGCGLLPEVKDETAGW